MNEKDAIFSAEPERLKRLVDMGLQENESEIDAQAPTVASVGGLLERVGSQIGRYKLLDCIGEGGMGIVYLAEQVQPMRRRVALKLIKPGMDSKQVIARFEAERQALALLDHPNIAHVYDAGTTDHGRSYFVMEYVQGLPITDYCDQHKLNIRARIELFRKVCGAVTYAHRKGIIHRDLKPSNILISTDQGQEDPKIIDFGVAKAISQPLTQQTLYTEEGHWVGTPEYMSPEQALHSGQEIGNRSDIYSLGVVLYQLLTGVLPFDFQELRAEGVDRVRQVICEEDPKTPSTKLSSLTGEECRALAVKRGTDYKSLGRVLHGDLDWITLKALEKNPSKRYATADDLAEDLNRSLRHEPIVARPIGPIERSLRRIRRHPWATATAASILIALLMTGLLVWRHLTAPVEALVLQDVRSLAVLPFHNASGNSDYDYIIEGISVNLIRDLETLPELYVAPESSVQQFAGPDLDLAAIQEALQVEVVLRGRLTRDEDIHIELIDRQSNQPVREKVVQYTGDEERSLHQEIGHWVAAQLGRDTGRAAQSEFDQRYTSNPEAYRLYLKGGHDFRKFTPESMNQAIEHFEKAIEIDPTFALAHADLANLYITLGTDLWSPNKAFPPARRYAEEARQLDDTLAEAYIALSSIALFYDRDWIKAKKLFEQAQVLDPKLIENHPCALHGRHDATQPAESLPFIRSLLVSNPHSFMLKAEVGCVSYSAGEYTGSIEQYSTILELNPSYHLALWGLGRAYAQRAQRGDYAKAIDVLEQGREPLGDWSVLIADLGYVYAIAGENEKAEEMLSLLRSQSADSYVDPYLVAMVHVGLGDHAQALSELNRAEKVNSTWLPGLRVEPKFDPLHDTPEFTELLDRVGLAAAQK